MDGLEEAENILQNFFDENLQLQNIEVESAHKVGNEEESKKEQKLPSFESFKDKQSIFSKTRKLKVTNINISEDYFKEI